jgi:8-oxo-dGTP diphosphatase
MPFGDESRSVVCDLVAGVSPFDVQEAADQSEILQWVNSGAPLFRIASPATPARHLVVYFVPLDEASRAVLLVDHVKAKLWLPPGGHVDDGEDPRRAVEREAAEELGITAKFHDGFGGDAPFFMTVARTRGEHSHTDVTLWFVLMADRDTVIEADPREFTAARWFRFDEPAEWTAGRFDPQMHRFISKLTNVLDTAVAAS